MRILACVSASAAQVPLFPATDRLVVIGPPLVVHALQTLSDRYNVVASTAFISQLPLLVARYRPDAALLYHDGQDLGNLELPLRELHRSDPQIDCIVFLPRERVADARLILRGIGTAVYRNDLAASEVLHILAAGGELPGEAQGPVHPLLTRREVEVLHIAAQGLTNAAIAQRLRISECTVKNHLRNVYTKLPAASRTQAVVRATRLGILQLPAAQRQAAGVQ